LIAGARIASSSPQNTIGKNAVLGIPVKSQRRPLMTGTITAQV
jgi:hypothetical protein